MSLLLARIVTGVVGLVMVALIFSPYYFASFYVVFRPVVQPIAFLHYNLVGNIPLTSVFALLLILSAVFTGLFRRGCRLLFPQLWPLYVLALLGMVSFFYSQYPFESVSYLLKLFCGIALFTLVHNGLTNREKAIKFLWSLMLGSILPMIYGYYQYITGTGHAWKSEFYAGSRIDSLLGEYNAYGIFLCLNLCAGLMLFLLSRNERKKRFVIIGFLCSLGLSLLLSLNRGSWLAMAGAICFASVFFLKKIKIRWFVIIGMVLLLVFGSLVYQRFSELTQSPSGRGNTLEGRINTWKTMLPFINNRIISGYGIGTTESVINKPGENVVPHNDYLRLALELGMVGLLSYLIFLLKEFFLSMFRVLRRENWAVEYPFLICVTYFIIISFTQNIIYNVINFPLFLGMSAITRRLQMFQEKA